MQDPLGTLRELQQARESGETLLAVHYACESFAKVLDRPLAVACLGISQVDQGGNITFSTMDVPPEITDQDSREIDMLDRFYAYLTARPDARLIHWNMHAASFGFGALADRYRYLTGKPPAYTPTDSKLVDLDGLIGAIHGPDYARHQKLPNLGRLNGRSWRSALFGLDEVQRFEKGELGAVTASVAEKVRAIAEFTVSLTQGTLKTQTSVGSIDFAGNRLDAVEAVLAIGDKFRDVERQLRRRHAGRDTLIVSDEYDAQDLVHSLLRLFFDNIVAESVTPSYAGKSTRIDFVLPDYRLGVELKMTRSTLTDSKVADQLIEDRERYAVGKNINHLICLVFDFAGELVNPRGLERDLSRGTSTDALAVTVKIFDR